MEIKFVAEPWCIHPVRIATRVFFFDRLLFWGLGYVNAWTPGARPYEEFREPIDKAFWGSVHEQ